VHLYIHHLRPCGAEPRAPHLSSSRHPRDPHSFPTRRSSDLLAPRSSQARSASRRPPAPPSTSGSGSRTGSRTRSTRRPSSASPRSEEHTSELQSRENLVCRLLLEKKKLTRRVTVPYPRS